MRIFMRDKLHGLIQCIYETHQYPYPYEVSFFTKFHKYDNCNFIYYIFYDRYEYHIYLLNKSTNETKIETSDKQRVLECLKLAINKKYLL